MPLPPPAIYSPAQLKAYFKRISLPASYQEHPIIKNKDLAKGPEGLDFLKVLQQHHLTSIPFESLSLHYSTKRVISIKPQDIFHKIVEIGIGRGGYCMENNALLGNVLRSLGYEIYPTGGRVNFASLPPPVGMEHPGAVYMGWNHMVHIVTISNQRYLVDVGYGANGPHHPLPLISGVVTTNVYNQNARLVFSSIPDNSDPNQKLWVYESQYSEAEPWFPAYCFTETEFLHADFEVMNMSTSNLNNPGFFVGNVLCVEMLVEDGILVGDITLWGSDIKRRVRGKSEIVATCKTEEERVQALKQWFGIELSEEEKAGIKGLRTELKEENE